MRKFLSFFLALSLLSVSALRAEVLLVEDFDYPSADARLTDNGWFTQWGSASDVQVTSGLEFNEHPGSGIGYAACLDMRESDPLHHLLKRELSDGALYFSFLFQPTVVGKSSWFAALRDRIVPNDYSSFNMNARVLVSTNNEIGLTFADNKKAVYNSLKQLDQTSVYFIVVKYSIVEGDNNDEVSLFLFEDYSDALAEPELPFIGPLTDSAKSDINPANVILRGFDNNSSVVVDAMRCGTSWSDVVPPRGCSAVEDGDDNLIKVLSDGLGVRILSDDASNRVSIFNPIGHKLFENSNVPEELFVPLRQGIYIVCVNDEVFKIVIK